MKLQTQCWLVHPKLQYVPHQSLHWRSALTPWGSVWAAGIFQSLPQIQNITKINSILPLHSDWSIRTTPTPPLRNTHSAAFTAPIMHTHSLVRCEVRRAAIIYLTENGCKTAMEREMGRNQGTTNGRTGISWTWTTTTGRGPEGVDTRTQTHTWVSLCYHTSLYHHTWMPNASFQRRKKRPQHPHQWPEPRILT